MHILDELEARGFIKDLTDPDGLRARMDEGPITFYCGYDPTNTSLTAGNLVPVMLQAFLQRAGHKPIVVLGGGTALIGDPSGKNSTRAVLGLEEIQSNLASQRPQFGTFLRLAEDDPATGAVLVNNAEWLCELDYISFLRDVGSHFSVNEMVKVDTYATRLNNEQHLSFVEFNYRLVQAYDFLHLFREQGCQMQVGGSDQWGNCVAGTELIRKAEGAKAWVLTTPLLTTATGQKMGKTERGAVWLDPQRTSPFDYFQYWINVDDRDVGRFLRLFTFLALDAIEALEAAEGTALIRSKAVLAWQATALCHGEEAASKALVTSMLLFGLDRHLSFDAVVPGGTPPQPDIPRAEIPRADLEAGVPVFKLFVAAGLASSGKQAKGLAQQGGASINGEVHSDPFASVDATALREDGTLLLRAGKKKFCLVVLT